MPQPSVGRTVHFVSPTAARHDDSTVCFPAIITALAHPDREGSEAQDCVLTVFTTHGSYVTTAPHDEVEMQVRSWHWPEIV
jgi:hypothetical protein